MTRDLVESELAMSKPWEQQPKEPARWHGRFHDNYLVSGTERSIDEAFRAFKTRERNDGKPAHGRAPGAWHEIAKKWSWIERARAYDADQRRRIRDEHFRLVKETQRKHRILLDSAIYKFAKGFQHTEAVGLSFPQYVALLTQLVNLDRLVMGLPLTIEQVQSRFGKIDDESTENEQATIAANVDARLGFTNSDYAEIISIMATNGAFDDEQ
jgi:hypothetical protein